jgi:membrane protein YdbS with pleckstrin-like domain
MSEDEHDNSDVVWLWTIIIGLYLLSAAIYQFGWAMVVLAPISVVTASGMTVLLVRTYLQSEWRHYRTARRDIQRIIKWGRQKINQVSRT